MKSPGSCDGDVGLISSGIFGVSAIAFAIIFVPIAPPSAPAAVPVNA
jgi:hypothetical protein